MNRDTAPVEQATGATLTMPHSAQMREATWMTEREGEGKKREGGGEGGGEGRWFSWARQHI